MKKILRSILLLTALLSIYTLNAQYTPVQKLNVIARSSGQKIQLRWALTEANIWQEANAVGYTIKRYTSHIDGVAQDGLGIQASEVILKDDLLPYTEAKWDNKFTPDDKFATVAKGTLYEEDMTIELTGNPTLADAVNTEQSMDSRFLFALYAAEQKFQVAKGLALGYADNTVLPGRTYIYRISLNSTNPEFSSVGNAVQIGTDDVLVLPKPAILGGEGGDKSAIIEWDIDSTKAHYSTYDIERSTDGQNFELMNDLPFVFANDGEEDPTSGFFKDELPENNVTYYYRIKGRTPFGRRGPPSNVVEVTGIPPRLPLYPSIEKGEILEDKVEVSWNTFPDSLESAIQGFYIMRSEDANKGFNGLNESPLSPQERSFEDNMPLVAGYYMLKVVDFNDHEYFSPVILAQVKDNTPPAVPIGLHGRFVTPYQVELKWDANTEADLKGYRLFMGNQGGANFVQITEQPVVEERFLYTIDPKFMVDSIFFSILSTDQRENYSDRSEMIAIARPDIVPPSSPTLYKVTPTPEGIQIGWRFSESDDRVLHRLERKRSNGPDWESVLKITAEEEGQYLLNLTPEAVTATCYLDTTILERRPYTYRMTAEDDQGNQSSSDVIEVRPYDSGKRGEIEVFDYSVVCYAPGNVPNEEAFIVMEYILNQYATSGTIGLDELKKLYLYGIISEQEYANMESSPPAQVALALRIRKMEVWGADIVAEITLNWVYSNQSQLVDFQIFRSAEGSALQLYETIPVDQLPTFTYVDKDAKAGRRYIYQIMARHLGGGFSERSEVLMVRVPEY